MKPVRTMIVAAALLAALAVTPAYALEYSVDGPSAGAFGAPTSDTMEYVVENPANVDRSKSAALIPPGFGVSTGYLTGRTFAPVAVETPAVNCPLPAYTAVTAELYYSEGYVATIQIPRLGVSVKVYEGTDTAQLAEGVGHFPGTSIWDGNVAVAGHNRGVNSYFGNIHELTQGDMIILTTKLGTRSYAVTGVFKVEETDRSMLSATIDNCITLYTCVRNQSTYRWCVRAVEI